MEEEKDLDVNMAEESVSEPSTEETSQDEPVQETGQEEKKVPLSRLKQEVARRKAVEELYQANLAQLEKGKEVKVNKPETFVEETSFDTADGWKKHIASTARSEAERIKEMIHRENEWKSLESKEDIALYKDDIKVQIEKNPYLSPNDAYDLARLRNPISTRQQKQQLEEEVRQEIEAKQRAQVGRESTRKPVAKVDTGLINERDENGKFKYSLKELESMLKGN